ncbi:MAG TPA: hypothetical protein VFT50_14495 [Baekduia sp.]|nr:hypothetical protein [Baekduia sp.]
MIRIRMLRVVGVDRNYDVSFVDGEGRVRPLSVIAGEISTGKSSILDFIDYCFGASGHPRQIEVQRQGRAAWLEVELDGMVATIERPLFTREQWVWLHESAIDGMGEAHATRRLPIGPASNSKSLNWGLLAGSALEGTVLKQAPTQEDSATHVLSFRDVIDLAYLDERRLLSKQLLHEGQFMKKLKFQQLIEVMFGVHDQELAAMGDRIRMIEEERGLHRREIDSLRMFLEEQAVPARVDLASARGMIARQRRELAGRLEALEADMEAETESAQTARDLYAERRRATRHAEAVVRDRKALLQRLLPLRGQYAEDERKLVFFAEARRLFDPLKVTTCPSCLQALKENPAIRDGCCTLCGQQVSTEEEQAIDIDVERRSVLARLRAIDRYIEEVEGEGRAAELELASAKRQEDEARSELDSDLGIRLAPFVADRDRLVRQIEVTRSRSAELKRQLGYHDAIDRRTGELDLLQQRLEELRAIQARLQSTRPDKELVLKEINARFAALLDTFGFPKLNDPEPPYLTADFHPFVRGVPYEELRSRGATTLVAVAWQLTMFELATEQNLPHPGFLLIDSPQSGLKPTEASSEQDDFANPEIAERLWIHVRAWANQHPEAQLILVDNLPPRFIDDYVVVRYSGDPTNPPYGFIDNETGADGVAEGDD